MSEMGLGRHRRHRRRDVPVDELRPHMSVEHGAQISHWVAVSHGRISFRLPPIPLLIQPLMSGRRRADFRAPLPAGTARRGSAP
jgi:hypothetical protein